MGSLTHIREIFHEGKKPTVVKSHCCLCHREMEIEKKLRGNCCWQCNGRASRVAKCAITEAESDSELRRLSVDLEVETWWIDGVPYYKYPNGTLHEREPGDLPENQANPNFSRLL